MSRQKHTFEELIIPENNTIEKTVELLLKAFGTPEVALAVINYTSACIVSSATACEDLFKKSPSSGRAVMVSYSGDIKWQKLISSELKSLRDASKGNTPTPEAEDNGIDEVI
tara:strand:+ start:1817 stop:2152 length:336 start_codon:yes stop_codon:yes gene_type:complete